MTTTLRKRHWGGWNVLAGDGTLLGWVIRTDRGWTAWAADPDSPRGLQTGIPGRKRADAVRELLDFHR